MSVQCLPVNAVLAAIRTAEKSKPASSRQKALELVRQMVCGIQPVEIREDTVGVMSVKQRSWKPALEQSMIALPIWVCEHCGGRVDFRDKYCRHCGAVFVGSVEDEA